MDGVVTSLDGGFEVGVSVTSLLVVGTPQPDTFVIKIMPRADKRNINNTFFIVFFVTSVKCANLHDNPPINIV